MPRKGTPRSTEIQPPPDEHEIKEQGRKATRRQAVVTQADVSRAIRAVQKAGLTIARVVARADGVSVETTDAPSMNPSQVDTPRKRIPL